MLFAPIFVSHNRTKTHILLCNIFRKWKYKQFKLKSLVVSSWFSQMNFIYFVNPQGNGQWFSRFCPPLRIFFLASYFFFFFWTALSESTCRTLLLEQYFSFRVFCKFFTNWMIIHSSNFFSEIHNMIAYDYYIIIPLYDCYDVTFCICSLYFNWLKDLSKKKKS